MRFFFRGDELKDMSGDRGGTGDRLMWAKVRFLPLFVLVAVVAGGASAEARPFMRREGRPPRPAYIPVRMTANEYLPGQVLVKYRPGVNLRSAEHAIASCGGKETLGWIGPQEGEKAQMIRLKPGVQVEEAVRELNARSDVEYAEPNYIYRTNYVPNDACYQKQWGLNNDGQRIGGSVGKKGADIDAQKAWDTERGYSNPVTVAVIDTGVDFTHPDLKSKLLSQGYNYAGITQSDFNAGVALGDGFNSYFAQEIKGTGGRLTHVGIMVQRVGNPDEGLHIGIRKALPVSEPFSTLASFTVSPAEISTAGEEIYKKLSNPVTLESGES